MLSANTKSRMKNYMKEPEVTQELQALLDDKTFKTVPGYSIDGETYPDHKVPFIADHLNYLRKHPQVDPANYLSNLRLMLKIR